MLTAIELNGFKSFADRTRLEFEDGISALIGPNGSGKSNIVDAIKWVLGEQSMKKLRGSESTDVIFSGSSSRGPLGSAEVTLTFDNSGKIFDLDTPEVHITRRIYRSGEGEYLINRQASRLKDIKDILSGTGLGTQAYSIIEQGRVESLLQSSPIQRRVIFEEAAGISRFNARKQETLRRLERVDQNLVRLSDIVLEVDHQLKTAQNQVGKAQLYRQYTNRLQELRVQAGLVDYRNKNIQSLSLKLEVETLTDLANSLIAKTEHGERSLHELNEEIEKTDQKIRRFDGDLAATRERIAAEESTIEMHSIQVEEIETEMVQNGRQLIDLNVRSVDIEEMMRKTDDDFRKAKRAHLDISETYQQSRKEDENQNRLCAEKRHEKNVVQKEIEATRKEQNRLTGLVSGLDSKRATLDQAQKDHTEKLEKLKLQYFDETQLFESIRDMADNWEDTLELRKSQMENAKQRKIAKSKQLSKLTKELSDKKMLQNGKQERHSILEELIRKNEGLSPGVKEVLQQSRDPKSPFRHVFGLVADLLRVDVESASLIEVALGTNAQYVVVSPKAELFRHVEKHSSQFAGRVGFIWLDPSQKEGTWTQDTRFHGRAGVLGRADQFVKTDPAFAHLSYRLLGRTWIVESIAVARNLYKESDDRTNFLTICGELLTPDGALVVGPTNISSGLITRRSELRHLSEEQEVLDSEIDELEIQVSVASEHVAGGESEVEEETSEYQKAKAEYDSVRLKLSAAEERIQHSENQLRQLEEEKTKIESQLTETEKELRSMEQTLHLQNSRLADLECKKNVIQEEYEIAEIAQTEQVRKTTNLHIELAKSEERLDYLKDRVKQFDENLKERQNIVAEHHKRSSVQRERRDSLLLAILRIESLLASLYLKKEFVTRNIKEANQTRSEWNKKRHSLQSELKKEQIELQKIRTKAHTYQIELERCLQEQKAIIERMREDYEIDLTELLQQESAMQDAPGVPSQSGDSIHSTSQTADSLKINIPNEETKPINYKTEIDDLRNKLQRLGSVNLEAIETLEDLETRHTTLSNQYNDLLGAKKSIEKIIERIDTDTQKLFEETFHGVREHFRTLFQHLFGGGAADLVLENPNNILESGVEIVAKPPGKDLKSVTLLSGGEKTMTCVALLLAFFRFRPNPICILDECDAALDEGNIDRFVRVIKEFQTQTQFLMITHSKKTMAAAATIYGVTMQESGVSKPISVRFVDVTENGDIAA
ncbi:MAG: chromosome segregation protein SMC [Thermoguttaceae bacterium]